MDLKSKSSDLIRFNPNVVLVGGPSGVGKTSIVNTLIELKGHLYSRPLSYTSRSKRSNENNTEFIFVKKEEIFKMLEENKILTIDEVYGNFYSISRESLQSILSSGKIPIKEVHPKNHKKFKKFFPGLISVLILPTFDGSNDQDANSSRQGRESEDIEFYSGLDLNEFDIILYADNKQKIESIAQNLDIAIISYTSTSHYFPPPPIIDKINVLGYGKAAPEFSEDKRITTKNFHDLSFPFFQNFIEKELKSSHKCLEIGPGQGWLRNNFKWPSVEYLSIDVSHEMIKQNKNEGNIKMSVRALNFPDKYFDVVLASLADPYFFPAALCEIRRVLKDNGIFTFSIPTKTWSNGIRKTSDSNKTIFVMKDGSLAEVYSFTFDIKGIKDLLYLCGLSISKSEVVFGKKLPKDETVSPAIINSSKTLGIKIKDLPIINNIISRKRMI